MNTFLPPIRLSHGCPPLMSTLMSTITLLLVMGIISTNGTCRKCKKSLGGKVQVKYKQPYVLVLNQSSILDWFSQCAYKINIRENNVLENLKLNFKRAYSFSVRKTPTDTYKMRVLWFQLPLHWANSEGMEATVLADLTFPSMAAALYLCPKLVIQSRRGCHHVNFKWLNHMHLAQW